MLHQRRGGAADPGGDRPAAEDQPAAGGGAAARGQGGSDGGARGARGARKHYLDAGEFTQLFHQRRKNHEKICLGLQKLVAGIARGFSYRSANDRREIEANALLHAIERIDRFSFAGGGQGGAFAYYTTIIQRKILRQFADVKRLESRARLFADLDAEGGRAREAAGTIERAKPYTRAT